MASSRSLIPLASLRLHSKQLQHRLLVPSIRHASTTPPPPKPRVLEKPERFNPPSHPSRLRYKPKYHGPPISERERQAQQTRRYPHMMPPEGTFMHWFLSNRAIHAWITMTVLIGLVLAVWISDFLHSTPYTDLLPPNSLFWAHPFSFVGRYWEVYKMHIEHVSIETQERRRRKVEDVRKRSEYRKAHGLDQGEGVFGGWVAKGDREVLGPGAREGRAGLEVEAEEMVKEVPGPKDSVELAQATVENLQGKGEEEQYVDFEGRTQRVKKKWFGIW